MGRVAESAARWPRLRANERRPFMNGNACSRRNFKRSCCCCWTVNRPLITRNVGHRLLEKKNVDRKFSAVVSAICAQNVLQEYLLFGQVLRWQIRIQVKAGLHPKLVWLAKDTRFLWGVVLLSVVVVRVCVCLVVTVIFGVFQACHVAQGSSETGAQEPPDDGGRVEGNWCPAEPGMDSLHDPPARWVTSSGASPLTAYVT